MRLNQKTKDVLEAVLGAISLAGLMFVIYIILIMYS